MKTDIENKIRNASPLDLTNSLIECELHDKKLAQEIIDEVYKEFESGVQMEKSLLEPIFLSILDGILECKKFSGMRKKGLTATRLYGECKEFSYDTKLKCTIDVDGYTKYKNAKEYVNSSINPNMSQKYDRNLRKKYEDGSKMKKYKVDRVVGNKMLKDEYTGKTNLYLKKNDPHKNYNDPTHRYQAQPDHIVPIKVIHDKYKENFALNDKDIKEIANISGNFAVTSGDINQKKKDKTNTQFVSDEKSLDSNTAKTMIKMEKNAVKQVDKKVNTIISKKISSFDKELYGIAGKNALNQSKDNIIGYLIINIVKPLYYELKDIFTNGIADGVGANSILEAFKIRFGRIKKYIMENAAGFFEGGVIEFIKSFISSLIEQFINLFVGIFKQVIRLIKEGVKIFIEAGNVLFGKNSHNMTAAQKGDAIIKIIGGSIIGIAGIGIESMLNKIGIGEPLSVILSTMLSGIASALFMYLLNKADLFSTKAEKRRERIEEIFTERIKDIEEAKNTYNVTALEQLQKQRDEFDKLSFNLRKSIDDNNIDRINDEIMEVADFMNIELKYRTNEEFVDYFDSLDSIDL